MIVEGRKTHTIRGHRKRHARPGELIQLYQGMRTKQCRKIIPDPVCNLAKNIGIWVPNNDEPASLIHENGRTPITHDFAYADGFEDVDDFTRFWFDTHGPGAFDGVQIGWDYQMRSN